MPNHIQNRLTVTGPRLEVQRFIDKSTLGGRTPFDFRNVYPMPKELVGTREPVLIQTPAEIKSCWAEFEKMDEKTKKQHDNKPWGLGMTQEHHDKLVKKYGCASWYPWAISHWGTKWGSYEASSFDLGVVPNSAERLYYAVCSYQTAWSPGTEFFLHVSGKFSKLTFKHEFADEGGGFVGWEEINGGQITNKADLDWDTTGKELRTELGYGDLDEAGDNEGAD